MQYTAAETLRLAKRQGNEKRGYLLVNPLQAKHMPARPHKALSMMERLGQKLKSAYPDTGVVIGFAETATAIGAVAASCFDEDCIYLHTTREGTGGDGWVEFEEEHSHAVEQRLYCAGLLERIAKGRRILFVDDEISTGKTLRNIVSQLRAAVPGLLQTPIAAASIIDRLTPEHVRQMEAAGVESEYLVKLPHLDYRAELAPFETQAAMDLRALRLPQCEIRQLRVEQTLPNPRLPVRTGDYVAACRNTVSQALALAMPHLGETGDLLVLGTEECMYPALLLGSALETAGRNVRCHATTRSPIGVCGAAEYPIQMGYQINSFYAPARETYLYNLRQYDTVLVLSDTPIAAASALADLAKAAGLHGCRQVIYIAGGAHV